MKAKLSRLLFGALAFATMCFTAPAINASAGEVEKDSFVETQQFMKEQEFQKEAEISKEAVTVKFTNFAEFKAIVESAGTERIYAIYTGAEAFVIEESITLPGIMDVTVTNAEVIIPANVKLTAPTFDNDLYFDKLIVKGTLELKDAYLNIYELLDVQGKIMHDGFIYLEQNVTIKGRENIEFANFAVLVWRYTVANTAELKAAVAVANSTKEDTKQEYDISFNAGEGQQGVINESVTIPENVRWLDINIPVTLAKGATLTMNTSLYLYQPLTVEGTLVNGVYICIEDNSSYSYSDGRLTIADTATYSGRGNIYIYCAEDVDYKRAVPGLDLSYFEAVEEEGYSHCWSLYHIDAYNIFEDVSVKDWYYPYVLKAWENGLMSGVGTTEEGLIIFAPKTLMSRAMFVQVLYGIEGKPAVAYSAKFSDVADGQWYTSAVLWAAENGITSGVSETEFGVNQNITREQMALMLMKYAELIGADVSGRANMDAFVDWESVSSWAKEAMQWAVANGVMSGEAGGKLNPQGKADRAVGATMFNAFYEKVM